jgi:hypothetical protein
MTATELSMRIPRIPGLAQGRPPKLATTTLGGIRQRGIRTRYEGGRQAPPKPSNFPGDGPEWAIYWGLERIGLRPNVDFTYLVAIANHRGIVGYTEADLVIWPSKVAIMVNGEWFHYEQGGAKQAFDRVQYSVIAGKGFQVVVIDAADAMRDPMYYAAEANAGRSHSRQRGLF